MIIDGRFDRRLNKRDDGGSQVRDDGFYGVYCKVCLCLSQCTLESTKLFEMCAIVQQYRPDPRSCDPRSSDPRSSMFVVFAEDSELVLGLLGYLGICWFMSWP